LAAVSAVTTPPRSRREIVVAFSGIMLATLLAALDQTIVATALPQIVADLRGFEHLSWVVTAYLLTSTVTIPLYGRLSDIYGRRPLFVVSISIFVVASVLCGVAQSMGQLIAFRALQGLGAGGLIPLAQAAVADLFSPRERGRYQGFIGAVWATAAVAGPLLGGTLTDAATWRLIFLVNLPLGLLALVVVVRTLRPGVARAQPSIDYLGATLLTVAILGVLLAAVWGGTSYGWTSWPVAAALASGVAAGVAFVAVERRVPEPILPLSLFSNRTFVVATAAAFVIGAVLFLVTIYVPVFVQGVLGGSATRSGIVLIPLSLGWVVVSAAAGQVVARTGRYRGFPIAGAALVVAGMWLLSRLDADSSAGFAALALVVLGVGMGVSYPVYLVATQSAVAPQDVGVATSSLLFLRTMGGALAIGGVGALLAGRLHAELTTRLGDGATRVDVDRLLQGGVAAGPLRDASEAALGDALHAVFLAGLPLALAGVALALALPARELRTTTS